MNSYRLCSNFLSASDEYASRKHLTKYSTERDLIGNRYRSTWRSLCCEFDRDIDRYTPKPERYRSVVCFLRRKWTCWEDEEVEEDEDVWETDEIAQEQIQELINSGELDELLMFD